MNIMHKLLQVFQAARFAPIETRSSEPEITGSHKPKLHWAELDILRGLAAALMIINHLGYETLNPAQLNTGLTSHLVFIGSFAPVLFFFVTGVGYGIQSKKPQKPNHWAILLNKVVILILADLFMHWSKGQWLGLDFFGFIGLSCIVLEFIRSSRHAILYALSGCVIISGLRYSIGPHLKPSAALGSVGDFWGWLIGTSSPVAVSYAFSPWIVYPLLGYVVGWIASRHAEWIKQRWLQLSLCLAFCALLPLAGGVLLANRGSVFFRWGTVSLSYYMVSFAAIVIALAGTLLIGQLRSLTLLEKRLSLPGVAAFAVVPIHYFFIYLFDQINPGNLSSISYYGAAIITLGLSFWIANLVNQFGQSSQSLPKPSVSYWSLVGIVVLAGTIVGSVNQGNLWITMIARTLGQTTLCLLFALRRN
jgi:uncharacterized membrane protein